MFFKINESFHKNILTYKKGASYETHTFISKLINYTVANLAADSRAKVTVVISQTDDGPKY